MDHVRRAAKRWWPGVPALLALVVLVAAPLPAHAQGAGGGGGGAAGGGDAAAVSVELPYLAQQMQQQSALAISGAVRGHIGALLAGAPALAVSSAASPAFAYAQPEQQQRQDNGLAAFAAVTATPKWSTWADVNATWSDRSDPIAGNTGWLANGSVALDYRVVERGVIGIIGSFGHSRYSTTFSSGKLRTWAMGGGVYGGYALTDVIIVDGLAQWQALDNDVSTPAATGAYGGRRVQLAAHITAYLTHGVFSIRPGAGISYTDDDYDAYVDSAGAASAAQWATTTTGTAGVEVGRIFDLGGGRSIEPWLGVTALLESVTSSPNALIPNRALPPFDVNVSAGLRTQLGERLSFTLKAEVGGLARGDYNTVLADGTFALQF
jgi:outer membrane autotransporter protein